MPASRISAAFVALLAAVALAACSSSNKTSAPPTTNAPATTAAPATTTTTRHTVLRVFVTNDDGVAAPGIDALVEAVRVVPNVSVTVVAPAENQSGTGGKTTAGTYSVTDAKTAGGYPAKAVHGYPADTVIWAIDKHGVAEKPDVVLSGVNNGQNIGAMLIDLSGTIGAARAAAQRGIPSLAVSAGLAPSPDYADGARAVVTWLEKHREVLLAGSGRATVTNVNVPSCQSGSPRPLVVVPVAGRDANPVAPVNCTGPAGAAPTSDVDGFVRGYVVETDNLALTPSA